jgi:hypothetical protein
MLALREGRALEELFPLALDAKASGPATAFGNAAYQRYPSRYPFEHLLLWVVN